MITSAKLAQLYLDEDQRARFIKNVEVTGGSMTSRFPYDPETFVGRAFVWANTPEGFDYWAQISKDLPLKIASKDPNNMCGDECMGLKDCPEEPCHCETGMDLLRERAEGKEER